jgi:hypothetical protein
VGVLSIAFELAVMKDTVLPSIQMRGDFQILKRLATFDLLPPGQEFSCPPKEFVRDAVHESVSAYSDL